MSWRQWFQRFSYLNIQRLCFCSHTRCSKPCASPHPPTPHPQPKCIVVLKIARETLGASQKNPKSCKFALSLVDYFILRILVPTYSLRHRTSIVLQQHLELGLEEIPWALQAYCPGKKSHSFFRGWLDQPTLSLTLSVMVSQPRKEVTLNLIPFNRLEVLPPGC